MKKLMIAATAAMAGAATFGGLCDPEAAGPDSCSVYNIKFTFKTLMPKTACAQGAKWLVSDSAPGTAGSVWYRQSRADAEALKDNTAGGGTEKGSVEPSDYIAAGLGTGNSGTIFTVCENGNGLPIQNADFREVYWMDNATRKFEGIAWQCKAACFEGRFNDCDLTNNGRLNYVIWEKKNSLAISFPVFQLKYGATDNPATEFKGTPETLYFSLDAQRSMLIGRYGKKAQKVTAFWNLAGRLLHGQQIFAAGFGTYDAKNLRTKSISGNAVGMIMPVGESTDHCGNKGKIFCALGFMCVEWKDWCCDGCYAGVELVPASGTWSLKYNASATKKANKDKATLADFVPAYMFYTHDDWKDARDADPLLHTDNYYYWSTTAGVIGPFYKDGAAAAAVTDDLILDYFANGACTVIDIVFDGVKSPDGTKYTWVGGDIELEDGLIPAASVFGESPVDPETGKLPEAE